MKKGAGANKGSSFEREICKELSLWWTDGDRDDIFWRTAGSGGRATNRMKRGLSTSGAYGDIMAVDASGADLLRLVCFELKRGYGQWCVLDAVDRRPGSKPSMVESFWMQASRSALDANARYAVVIFRRDQKQTMIMSSEGLLTELSRHRGPHRGNKILFIAGGELIFLMPLAEFLEYASPQAMRAIA